MDELAPGTILGGRYCVERLVAQGGMSRLYQGHPLQGAGRVAIKQLDVPESGTVDPEDLRQFQKEYEILHGLQHPGLAQALDFFEEDGRHYLVEEFVPGETLEAHIQAAGRVPCDEAVQIMWQLLHVLEHLHGHEVIYRDLKPQNVILQPWSCAEGEPGGASFPFIVRLVDFGTARRWKRHAAHDTVPLGTPGFAPPEQYGKAQSDARSDVYGAGALLHYMLTGSPPDPAQGWVFAAPHELVCGIPPDLGAAVLKAVQVDAGKRFQDASEMRRALLRAMGRLPNCPECDAELPESGTVCRRCSARGARILVATVLALLGIVAAIVTPHFFKAWHQGRLTACKSNLKNIGTALEMYSSDNGGRFPTRFGKLIPNYLKAAPTCPSAGWSSYCYVSSSSPDAYTVVCQGVNHGGVNKGENYPQYTSKWGFPDIAQ